MSVTGKHHAVLPIALALVVAACGGARQTSVASTPTLEAQIQAVLDGAATAYAQGDYSAFMDNFVPGEQTTVVIYAPGAAHSDDGTKRHILQGKDAIGKFYAEAPMFKPGFDRPKLAYRGVHVSRLGVDAVNVIAEIVVDGGDERVPRLALTSLVLVNRDGRWRVLHDHTH